MEEATLNMNLEEIESETPYLKQHNTFIFEIQDERKITFSSEFDSGNCGNVQQTSHFEYDVCTAADRDQGTQQEGYSKSWFFFCVKGFKPGEILKLNIQYVHMLWSLWNNKATQNYHPVYKIGETGELRKLFSGIQIHMEDKNRLVLTFEFLFTEEKDVYFSFSYPYQYFRGEKFVKNLAQDYADDPEIYLHSEVIALSPQQRNIHLLTISSRQGITDRREDWLQSPLFPNKDTQNRPFKFKTTKPYVLITARVHPGETPSSYALEGIINFLLSRNDARAALLRHFFVFLIVPMLNPDGVYHGHYRMDVFNNNLNRFYKIADPIRQPSIFGIRNLVENLHKDRRLFFYIDLHAHAGKKGHFMYGNAFEDLIMQIESQTFAKVLALNCSQFEYNYCNFSKKHMKARDKFEEMTKEGCGRVQVLEMTNLIHTFTLECGFHQSSASNAIPPPTNEGFRLNEKLGLDGDEQTIEENKDKKDISVSFSPQSWENVGKAVVISILDVFEKNPYSRIPNSLFKNIENIRRSVGWDCARLERFRQDPLAYKKARKTQEFIHQAFFGEFEKKNVFSFQHKFFKDVKWPEDLQGNFLKRYNSESVISLSSSSANKKRIKKPRQSAMIRSRASMKNILSDTIEDKSELIGNGAQDELDEKKKNENNLENNQKEVILMNDKSVGSSAEHTAKCYELYRLLGGNASKRELLEKALMKSSERGKNQLYSREDKKKMDDSSIEIQENSYRILQCKKAIMNEKSERLDNSAEVNDQGQSYELSKRRRKKSINSFELQQQQQNILYGQSKEKSNLNIQYESRDGMHSSNITYDPRRQQSSRLSKSLKSNGNSSYYQEPSNGLEQSNCGVELFGGWKFEQMMPNVSNRKQILKRSFAEERLHRQLEEKAGKHVSASTSSSCMSLKDILSNGISSIVSSSSSLIQKNPSNRRSVNGYEMILQQQQDKQSMIQKSIHQEIIVSGEINTTTNSTFKQFDQNDNTATNPTLLSYAQQGSKTGSVDSQNTDAEGQLNSQLRKEEIPFRNGNNGNQNNQEIPQPREDENIRPPRQQTQQQKPSNRHEIKEFKCFNIMDYTLFSSNNLPSLSVPPKTQMNPPPAAGTHKSSVFQKCDALFVQPLQQATLYGKHRRSRDSNPSSMLGINTMNHQKRNQVLQKSCKLIEGIFNKILHKKLDITSQQQQQQADKSVSQNTIPLDNNQGNRNTNINLSKIGSASPTGQKQEFKQLPLSNKKETMKRGGDTSVTKDVSISKNSFSEDFRLPGIPSKKGDSRQGGSKSSSLQPRQYNQKSVL